MARSLLLPQNVRGKSCASTLCAAFGDTELRPEVLHIVGVGDAERSMDFEVLAKGLEPGARVVLIGPHALGAGQEPREELLGPELKAGLQVFLFPQTYQRFLVHCQDAEAPQFVALFHPGLDVHYYAWYSCLKHWVETRVPLFFSAYKVPGGLGETPTTVKTFLETLVGMGGGAGLWVIEEDNPHSIDDGSFNAGYFMTLGSQGSLPLQPGEMYWPLFQALQKVGHPFAPRVGYLDIGDEGEGKVSADNVKLLAAIAEGAVQGAQAGSDGADESTARGFAAKILDQVVGPGAGKAWTDSGFTRTTCAQCGEGFDSELWHRAICPAVGRSLLCAGDQVRLVALKAEQLNGKEGVLQHFNRERHRWVVRMGDRDALFKAANLERNGETTTPAEIGRAHV